MGKPKLITKKDSTIVDLGTKLIHKYTSLDRQLEINHMEISGRHPENPNHFIYETKCHFMIYIICGKGTVICNTQSFDVRKGDVIDVPVSTRFAVEGERLEYITVETPAWFPQQASIVDSKGKVVEE
ncbi:MAG: hypothetical protein PHS44_01820 [Candidatus Dojkabacteria bacterium]|jgi:mannose-6-phosphate isomerase-like protein (cupin superfamily)|nr:hypothetical protein [Candidatus Dojkabacteria bacterium]